MPPRKRRFETVAQTRPSAEDSYAAANATDLVDVAPHPPTSTPTAKAGAQTRRPVRVTVELQPDEYRELRGLCDRYADDIGVPRVAGAEVLRVLLSLAVTDARLATQLGKAVARTGGSRRRLS